MNKTYLKNLDEKFTEIYNFIYEHNNKVPGFRWMVESFDNYMKSDETFKRIATDFAQYRHDCISSDREAAAFMFAIAEL